MRPSKRPTNQCWISLSKKVFQCSTVCIVGSHFGPFYGRCLDHAGPRHFCLFLAKLSKFNVSIIPYTWENTSLKKVEKGDFLNTEVDMLARYVFKALKK